MKQTLNVYNLRRQEINIHHIKYIEGSNNYSIIHSTDHKPIVLSRSLGTFQADLPTFVRIHKRYLINPQFVATHQRLTTKQLTLILTTGELITVSRRRIAHVIALLTNAPVMDQGSNRPND